LDELVPLGFYPINFADTSGNPTASKQYRITKIIFSQPLIKGFLFVSCISNQQLDNTARGVIKALRDLYPETDGKPNIPVVLAIRGAWDLDAIRLFKDCGITEGKWIRILGRESTEQDAALAFYELYQQWAKKNEVIGI
jgi:succinyl-CoA synthetase beta subunit